MVEVVYNRKKCQVAVRGHANTGEMGHDLLCAGVSTLVYTLASNVEQLRSADKRIRRPVIELNEGKATISCDTVHGLGSVVRIVFDAVCSGFDILQRKYPQNISYKIID